MNKPRALTVNLAFVALLAALLPLVTIHAALLASFLEGYIQPCIPYWSDCTSISRAGRHGTAYFLFKGGMLPATVILCQYWWVVRLWLVKMKFSDSVISALPWIGLLASFSLLLYALTLGHEGEGFRLMRKLGVVSYFGLSWINQMVLSLTLRKLYPGLWRLALLTLVVGLVSVLFEAMAPQRYEHWEFAFEWWLVLLLVLHTLMVARYWQRPPLQLRM